MNQALYSLFTLLVVAGIIYYASTLLPDAFLQKIGNFIAGIIVILAVVRFVAYLLGVGSPF